MSRYRKHPPVIHTATSSRPLIHRTAQDDCENEPPALDTPTSAQMTLVSPQNSGKTIRVFDSYSRKSIDEKDLVSPHGQGERVSFTGSTRGTNQQSFTRNGGQYSSSKARQIKQTAELVKLPSTKSMLSTITSNTGHANPFGSPTCPFDGQSSTTGGNNASSSHGTTNMFDAEPSMPASQLHNSSFAHLNSSFNAGLSGLIRNDSTLMQRVNTSLGAQQHGDQSFVMGGHSRLNDSSFNTPRRVSSRMTPVSTPVSRSSMRYQSELSLNTSAVSPRYERSTTKYMSHGEDSGIDMDSTSLTVGGRGFGYFGVAEQTGSTHVIDVNFHNATCVMAYINDLNMAFFNSQYNDHIHRDVFSNTRNVMELINRTHEHLWVPHLPIDMAHRLGSGGDGTHDGEFVSEKSFTSRHSLGAPGGGNASTANARTTPQRENMTKLDAAMKRLKSYQSEQLQQQKHLTLIIDHEKQKLNKATVKLDTLTRTNTSRLDKAQKKDYEKDLKTLKNIVKEHEKEIKKLSERLQKEEREYHRELKKHQEKIAKLKKTQTTLDAAAAKARSSSSPKKGFISRLAGIARKDVKKKRTSRRSSSLLRLQQQQNGSRGSRNGGSRHLSKSPPLRRKGGVTTISSPSPTPLSPRACEAVQAISRNVPFVSMLQHPIGSRYFFKALEKEFATENFHFWRDVHLLYGIYSDLCDIRTFEFQRSREKYSIGDADEYYHNRLTETSLAVACIFFNAAQILIDTYIIDSSIAQVNIASGRRTRIISSTITLAEAFDEVNLAIETAADEYARDIEDGEGEKEADGDVVTYSALTGTAGHAPSGYGRKTLNPAPMEVISENEMNGGGAVMEQHHHSSFRPKTPLSARHTRHHRHSLGARGVRLEFSQDFDDDDDDGHTNTDPSPRNASLTGHHNHHPHDRFDPDGPDALSTITDELDEQMRLSSLLSRVRINFDSAIGEHIELVMEAFLSAASEIEHLMSRDSFPRFKNSELWFEMVTESIKHGQSGLFMNVPLSTTHRSANNQSEWESNGARATTRANQELSTFSTPVKPTHHSTSQAAHNPTPSSRAHPPPATTPNPMQGKSNASISITSPPPGLPKAVGSPYDQKRKYNYFRKHLRSSLGAAAGNSDPSTSTATAPAKGTPGVNPRRITINKKRLSLLLSPTKAGEMKAQIHRTIAALSPETLAPSADEHTAATTPPATPPPAAAEAVPRVHALDPLLAPTTISPSRRRRLSFAPSPALAATTSSTSARLSSPFVPATPTPAQGTASQPQPSTPFAFPNPAIPYATARLLTIKTSPSSPDALLSIVSECSGSQSPSAAPVSMMPTSLFAPMSPRLTSPVYGRPNVNHPNKTPRANGSSLTNGYNGVSHSGFFSPRQLELQQQQQPHSTTTATPKKRPPRAFFASPISPRNHVDSPATQEQSSSVRILPSACHGDDDSSDATPSVHLTSKTTGKPTNSAQPPMPTPVLAGAHAKFGSSVDPAVSSSFYGKSRHGKGVSPLLSRLQRLDHPADSDLPQLPSPTQHGVGGENSRVDCTHKPPSAKASQHPDANKTSLASRHRRKHRASIDAAFADFIDEDDGGNASNNNTSSTSAAPSTSTAQQTPMDNHQRHVYSPMLMARNRSRLSISTHHHHHHATHQSLATPSNRDRMQSNNAGVLAGFKSPFQLERQRTLDPHRDIELSPELQDEIGCPLHPVHHTQRCIDDGEDDDDDDGGDFFDSHTHHSNGGSDRVVYHQKHQVSSSSSSSSSEPSPNHGSDHHHTHTHSNSNSNSNGNNNNNSSDRDTSSYSYPSSLHNRYMLMKARFNRRISALENLTNGSNTSAPATDDTDAFIARHQHPHLSIDPWLSHTSSSLSNQSGSTTATTQLLQPDRSDSSLTGGTAVVGVSALHQSTSFVSSTATEVTRGGDAGGGLPLSLSNSSMLFSPRSKAILERETKKVFGGAGGAGGGATLIKSGSNRLSLGPMMYNFSSKKNVDEFLPKKPDPPTVASSSRHPPSASGGSNASSIPSSTGYPTPDTRRTHVPSSGTPSVPKADAGSRRLSTTVGSSLAIAPTATSRSPQINIDDLNRRLQRHLSNELDKEFDALMKDAP